MRRRSTRSSSTSTPNRSPAAAAARAEAAFGRRPPLGGRLDRRCCAAVCAGHVPALKDKVASPWSTGLTPGAEGPEHRLAGAEGGMPGSNPGWALHGQPGFEHKSFLML